MLDRFSVLFLNVQRLTLWAKTSPSEADVFLQSSGGALQQEAILWTRTSTAAQRIRTSKHLFEKKSTYAAAASVAEWMSQKLGIRLKLTEGGRRRKTSSPFRSLIIRWLSANPPAFHPPLFVRLSSYASSPVAAV